MQPPETNQPAFDHYRSARVCRSGDGSGIMTSVPWALLEREYSDMGVETDSLPPRDQRAVGMLFLPQAEDAAAECRSVVEKIMTQAGLEFHGWRSVPVDPSSLGQQSRENQPNIQQVKCCCYCCALSHVYV